MNNEQSNCHLRLPRDEMRALGYRVIDILVEHFGELPQKPVTRIAERAEMERQLCEPLPDEAREVMSVLSQLQAEVFSHIMHVDPPRFFAFVPSPSNFVSVMAEALASGFNVFAGTWLEGSGPAEIELVTIDWLRQLYDLPDTAGGLFVSGGSMANITALTVARQINLNNRSDGAVVYGSDQTHSSIERGLKVLGFQPSQLRKLPSDDRFRYEIGCVLVRENRWLKETFHILPEYLKEINRAEEEVNFCDYGIQLTRGFRALKLWMSLKVFGRKAFAAAVSRGFELAEFAENLLRQLPNWSIVTPAQMGIVTFRYVPEGASASEVSRLNERLVAEMIRDGFAMLSSTTLRGESVLRLCPINPRTTEADLQETINRLDRFASTIRKGESL